jgi:hypothetical protein
MLGKFFIIAASAATYPLKLPAPGGEVILPDARAKENHDEWRYATVRRVGDMLYGRDRPSRAG